MQRQKNKYRSLADEALLKALQSDPDNRWAFGEIYRRYGHLVFGTCLNYLKNKEGAEDLTMDIFAGLVNKIQRHNIRYFKSWLYQVTKNECLMQLRKNHPNTLPLEEGIIPNTVQNGVEMKEQQETIDQLIVEIISELNSPQREAIQLFYMKGLTYQAISQELALSLKKVKSALQNGKRNLRIKLEQHDLFKSAS